MGLPRSHGALATPLRNRPQFHKRSLPHILWLPHTHPLTNAHILKEHRHPLALPPSLTLKHTHGITHKNTSNHIPALKLQHMHACCAHSSDPGHTHPPRCPTDSSPDLLRGPHHAPDTPPPMKSQMTHRPTGQQSQTHNHCNSHHRQAHTHSPAAAGIFTVRDGPYTLMHNHVHTHEHTHSHLPSHS